MVAKKDQEEEKIRKEEEEKERIVALAKHKEAQDELKAEIKEMLKPLEDKMDAMDEKISLTSDGTLASLRNDILTAYYKCAEKGFRNDYDFQNVHDLYEAYTQLHGNSFIKDVMDRFDKLPTKEVFEAQKKMKKTSTTTRRAMAAPASLKNVAVAAAPAVKASKKVKEEVKE